MSEYLIRLLRDSKQPPRGPQQISNDPAVHEEWLMDSDLGNMLKENKRVVLDFDGLEHKGGKDLAMEFVRKYRDFCTGLIMGTPSGGIHIYFSGETQTRKILDAEGREIGDVKASGYVKCIGTVRGKAYRILQDGPLQPFSKIEHLFPRKEVVDGVRDSKSAVCLRQRNDANEVTAFGNFTGGIKDVRAYIRKIPSVSGEHGHDACFRVACILRDAGFSEMEALIEMLEWEKTCASPLWGPVALAKKIRDAYRVVLKGL